MGENSSEQLLAMFAQFLGVPKEQIGSAIASFTEALQNTQAQPQAAATPSMMAGGKFDYLVNKLKTGGKHCPSCKSITLAKDGEKNKRLPAAKVTAEAPKSVKVRSREEISAQERDPESHTIYKYGATRVNGKDPKHMSTDAYAEGNPNGTHYTERANFNKDLDWKVTSSKTRTVTKEGNKKTVTVSKKNADGTSSERTKVRNLKRK